MTALLNKNKKSNQGQGALCKPTALDLIWGMRSQLVSLDLSLCPVTLVFLAMCFSIQLEQNSPCALHHEEQGPGLLLPF